MSDTETSGAETTAAAAVNPASAKPDPTPPTGTFGNTRGSGLARGKRPVSPPPQADATSPAADYQPTALSIVNLPTEYKNPFAPPAPPSPEPENPPPAPEAPAAEVASTPVVTEAPAAEPPASATADTPAAVGENEPAPKAELNILPPEETKRVEHSWESRSFREVAAQETDRSADAPRPRRDQRRSERPVFRPERPRRDFRSSEPRPEKAEADREAAAPATSTDDAAKSGGLFGWVKKIFGGPAPEVETKPASDGNRREFDRNGPRRRRRHRGGRGRNPNGNQRGSREGRPGGSYGGEPRGQDGGRPAGHHGGRRRRRRHHGGGGGGYRGGQRPDSGPPAGS